jgi:iron(III) transport system substrate-binding protein
MKFRFIACAVACCLILMLPSVSFAAFDMKSLSSLRDPERTKILLEQAKKEGELNFYTVVEIGVSQPVALAFEKKYGIRVNHTRASSDRLMTRFVTEARAGKVQADIMENDAPELTSMGDQGFFEFANSPQLDRYPKYIAGPNRAWFGSRYTFYVLGYNTRLVAPQDVPKTYDDLLHPRWKGKMMIEAEDVDWFAALWNHWGDQKGSEYFKKLGEQDLLVRQGHTNMTQLLSAGDAPLGITVYNHQVERLKKGGGPVEWIPLEPVVARLGGVAVVKNPPHPAAALLYFDFIFSTDGQSVLRNVGRSPTDSEVGSEPRRLSDGFKFIMVNPQVMADKRKELNSLFHKVLKIE